MDLITPLFDRDGPERPLQKPDIMVSVTVTVAKQQQSLAQGVA
ncbi:hypothetical protein [Candidatus Nitronereus thalassa]|uniref:Uncharacterized protein n=1 Tax=Candidatus Nitronereus thalassa TaxID=3020898 RepID=A0ABU3K4Z9_9BACT|nr:hypothetical protein [Candidatus Nitronereus thalassa]MDT7041461.1 hypothetical protein [Candidatus Nitronereus thalassa]